MSNIAPHIPTSFPAADPAPAPRLFLLSPANASGIRAQLILREEARFPLALRLREGRLSLGEAFAFISGLYFRGKLAYARMFGQAGEAGVEPALVITPTRGLLPASAPVDAVMLREFGAVDLATAGREYRDPLERDLAALVPRLSPEARVVLLGSIATGKYADVLGRALGDRLVYPRAFVGRGDMSRGGLLLRSVAARQELEYAPLPAGCRPRGKRPARLER